LLRVHPQGTPRRSLYPPPPVPALWAELVELLLNPSGHAAGEQLHLQFHDLVAPATAHFFASFVSFAAAFGSRPALRNASRNTYSICALRLRSSSSAQRCAAAMTSALMRSG